jgi:hypothetical protein
MKPRSINNFLSNDAPRSSGWGVSSLLIAALALSACAKGAAAASFDPFFAKLAGMGKVLQRTESAEDVMIRFYDLEGRLATKRELLKTFQSYLGKTKDCETLCPPWFFFLNFANYRKNSGNIEVTEAKVHAVREVSG